MRNLILLTWLLGAAVPSLAEDPLLELGQPRMQEGRLLVDVTLRGLLCDGSLESLEAGVPASLIFRWKVWREREGWRDAEVARGELENRVYFDVLEENYHLFDHRGRPLGACDALEGLTETLCRREAMALEGVPRLEKDTRYYLEMEVTFQTVGYQEVRGIESWLLGAEDAPEMSGETLGELTLSLIKKMAGLDSTTVRDVSPKFSLH